MTGWVFESLVLPKDDAAPGACEDRVLVLPPDFVAVMTGRPTSRASASMDRPAGRWPPRP